MSVDSANESDAVREAKQWLWDHSAAAPIRWELVRELVAEIERLGTCQCWVGHGDCGGCSGVIGISHEPACGWEWNPACPEHGLLAKEVERLRRFTALVEGFITDRAGYITALENCAPDNTADYWRWQGHAESRRQLLASLPWPPDTDDAERISKLARVTR